jgi:hypothetical protein
VAEVNAVELDDVKMNVESHGGIHALHGCDGACECVLDAGQGERLLRSALQRATELGDDSGENFCAKPPVVTKQCSQPPRERTDPVPNRSFRKLQNPVSASSTQSSVGGCEGLR